MKRTMRRSIVIFVSCLLLLCILNVPVLAWEWPCPNECYYWDGDDCIKIKDCGVADPCPDEEHYSCIDCECICDYDPYYTQNTPITPVSITSPSNNYVVCIDQTITLTCSTSTDSDIYHHCVNNVWTEEPVDDPVTHTWSGAGTFDPTTGTSVTWTAPSTAGQYTITVTATDSPKYDDSLDNPDPTDSITVYVIDDLTVFPREAYVCVSGTEEFAAWRRVDDIATDVTSSATFSTNNPGGSMKRTTGESTGPNNKILHPGSVSTSEGSDWVKATWGGGEPTDDDHDCELTVVGVIIASFDRVPPTKTKSVQVTVNPSLTGGSVELDVIRTAGTSGSATVSPTSISSTTNVTVTGGDQTSVGNPDNLSLRAKVDGCVCDSEAFTVCAHPEDDSFYASGAAPLPEPLWSTHYGIWVRYRWESDSDVKSHLDQCMCSETFSDIYEDRPPFYVGEVVGKEPFKMDTGIADDYRAVLKSLVYNYRDGHSKYTQEMKYECKRCGFLGDLSTNSVDHHVYWCTTFPGYPPHWRIKTSVVHSCPGVTCNNDQTLD